jgi:hypothetical protein
VKFAMSLSRRLEADKLVSALNKILEAHIKEEGSLEDSLLVISISKVVETKITLSSPP